MPAKVAVAAVVVGQMTLTVEAVAAEVAVEAAAGLVNLEPVDLFQVCLTFYW